MKGRHKSLCHETHFSKYLLFTFSSPARHFGPQHHSRTLGLVLTTKAPEGSLNGPYSLKSRHGKEKRRVVQWAGRVFSHFYWFATPARQTMQKEVFVHNQNIVIITSRGESPTRHKITSHRRCLIATALRLGRDGGFRSRRHVKEARRATLASSTAAFYV